MSRAARARVIWHTRGTLPSAQSFEHRKDKSLLSRAKTHYLTWIFTATRRARACPAAQHISHDAPLEAAERLSPKGCYARIPPINVELLDELRRDDGNYMRLYERGRELVKRNLTTKTTSTERLDGRMIGVREAKARLSELLRDVRRNRSWTITERGVPVARLVPVENKRFSLAERIRRREAEGILESPRNEPRAGEELMSSE